MSERFFSAKGITSDRLTLEGTEAHHLLHVMRAGVGDNVTLFDDSGAEFTAVVVALGRSSVDLRIGERCVVDRELSFPLTVGVALPKGDRQKWLVEKLSELGATMLVPLLTERGVAQPTAAAIERLERVAVEAAKQCGRNRLLRIAPAISWSTWTADSRSEVPARQLIAHPTGSALSQIDLASPLPTRIAIGPEGGFTDAEVAAAIDHGWKAVDLGPRILRVETAAIALACAVIFGQRI
jgi:16S rRNA (uracil1498-N3)-methyltransferase